MSQCRTHPENHLVERIGWLRASVLWANDGIVSTASLIVGVAAASARQSDILIADIAGQCFLRCTSLAAIGALSTVDSPDPTNAWPA